jgi:hypothetical protein
MLVPRPSLVPCARILPCSALIRPYSLTCGVSMPLATSCFFACEKDICQVCKTNFNTRLRLLAHLSDSRHGKCRSAILATDNPTLGNGSLYVKLSESEVARLDDIDRQARMLARQQGHTHVLAVSSAHTAEGTRCGHVTSWVKSLALVPSDALVASCCKQILLYMSSFPINILGF